MEHRQSICESCNQQVKEALVAGICARCRANYKESPLPDTGNVADLGFAWEYDARSTVGRVPRGLEATPFVVDGVMYTSGAWGFVYCLDAETGEEIWRYDPNVDASYNRRSCCDVVNRGVAVWEGKVINDDDWVRAVA